MPTAMLTGPHGAVVPGKRADAPGRHTGHFLSRPGRSVENAGAVREALGGGRTADSRTYPDELCGLHHGTGWDCFTSHVSMRRCRSCSGPPFGLGCSVPRGPSRSSPSFPSRPRCSVGDHSPGNRPRTRLLPCNSFCCCGRLSRLSGPILIEQKKGDDCSLREREALIEESSVSLTSLVVIVDRSGRIIAANEAWRKSSLLEGVPTTGTGVGDNYLEVYRRAAHAADHALPRGARGYRRCPGRRSGGVPNRVFLCHAGSGSLV